VASRRGGGAPSTDGGFISAFLLSDGCGVAPSETFCILCCRSAWVSLERGNSGDGYDLAYTTGAYSLWHDATNPCISPVDFASTSRAAYIFTYSLAYRLVASCHVLLCGRSGPNLLPTHFICPDVMSDLNATLRSAAAPGRLSSRAKVSDSSSTSPALHLSTMVAQHLAKWISGRSNFFSRYARMIPQNRDGPVNRSSRDGEWSEDENLVGMNPASDILRSILPCFKHLPVL
jgi:hypothetical protein